MSFYSDLASNALELLNEFGSTITLYRETGNSIDPISGVVEQGTDASVTTTGVLLKYPDSAINDRVLSSDKRLIVSNEQVPTLTDKPIIAGERLNIVSIDTLKPTDTEIIYILQVRK